MLAVVMLDDPRIGAGPGTVVKLSDEPIPDILREFTDRDGAKSDKLRIWRAHSGAKVGDRVCADTKMLTTSKT